MEKLCNMELIFIKFINIKRSILLVSLCRDYQQLDYYFLRSFFSPVSSLFSNLESIADKSSSSNDWTASCFLYPALRNADINSFNLFFSSSIRGFNPSLFAIQRARSNGSWFEVVATCCPKLITNVRQI